MIERADEPLPAGHFDRLLRLMELESAAQLARMAEATSRQTPAQAERTGQALVELAVVDEDLALGGRTLWTFAKRGGSGRLPWTRLDTGSPVLLREHDAPPGVAWRGIVVERRAGVMVVAFEDPPDVPRRVRLRLDLAYDEVARRRQEAALRDARDAVRGRLAQLRDVLLGARPPRFQTPPDVAPLDPNLNASQSEAVRFGLAAGDVAIIHGPPGTGKTTTVVELIRQAVRRGERVLACAPSNLGVDNLLQRLVAWGERAVRLGHPARVLEPLQRHTLDVLVAAHADTRLAERLVREAQALRQRAGRFTRAKPAPGARRELRQDARGLLADARRIEQQVIERTLDAADVVCATLTGLDARLLGERQFDLVVIDEAAQATEPAAWIAAGRAGRLVLAGDHCQLPPTILSPEAAREGFGTSLMQRLAERSRGELARLLEVQYRMHEAIMGFSSSEFYGDRLKADASVARHVLSELAEVADTPLTRVPLRLIDTAGAGYDEQLEEDGESRRNPQEAEVVAGEVRALLACGLAAEEIAVVTPYAAQVRLLRERLAADALEIDTVDAFQGREKQAVVISLVRSNERGEIGFLADVRRMNVALTRARRKLIVVGDSATIGGHPFYQRLLEHFERQQAYTSVWERE